jgi:hypothetical protein
MAAGAAFDCVLLLFFIQRERLSPNSAQIAQRQEETLQILVTLQQFNMRDSHSAEVKQPNTFHFVSKMSARVSPCPSQRRWKSFGWKPSR